MRGPNTRRLAGSPPAFRQREAAPVSHRLDRWDAVALLALTVVAFVLRFYSPIMPDFFLHPFQGPLVSDCVPSTPIDAQGDPGTLCGLAYPFNRGYRDPSNPTAPLSPPRGQVFDEVYFPVDAYFDFNGTEARPACEPKNLYCPYFDPEPPLAKLIIGAGEWGYGWYLAHFEGQTGKYIDLGYNTFGWRIAACIFGILCIPMGYLLARRLWPNRLFAIAVATLICFDGMFFVQSRIGMIDIFPMFFIMLAYYAFLVHIQSRTTRQSLVSLVLLGIVLGVGIASKWIVLAAFATIAFLLVMRFIRRHVDLDVGPPGKPIWSWGRGEGPAIPGGAHWSVYLPVALIALVAIPIGIYIASWYPFFARGQFQNLTDLWLYQQQSYLYHKNLIATHPFGSPWWSWPFLSRPVLYYAEYTGLGTDQFSGQPLVAWISNLGNPWIWWTSLPCVAVLPYFIVRHRSLPATVILLGFITQYLPWSLISRVIFLYHMFGGLIFMILALAFVLVQVAERLPPPRRLLLVGGHLGIAVACFVFFYPVWTALPISNGAMFGGPGAPPWAPKLFLTNCKPNLPPAQPQLWCWE